MTPNSQLIPAEILSLCDRCSEVLPGLSGNDECIDFVRSELPSLLGNKALFIQLMKNIARGGEYPDLRRPTMFDNELVLYIHKDQLFSLRMYLWGPGEFTFPHDHNSWGVIGAVMPGYEVINYRRDDDESREGYALLVEVERLRLLAGETAFTLPFNKGIHKTGNPTQEAVITLHLYGRSFPRGFLNGYDIQNNRVYRILPPKLKKESLAAQALSCLERSIP